MKISHTIITSLLLVSSPAILAQTTQTTQTTASAPVASEAPVVQVTKIDTKLGSGDEAKIGNRVKVNYTGWLYDPVAPDHKGKQFDSSVGRAPFEFQIGVSRVIKGWHEGVPGMKVGGTRTLIIPPELAYGPRARGDVIPSNSTLVFEIEMLGIMQ